MVRFTVGASGEASTIVPNAGAKTIVSPLAAAAIAFRSVPLPLSPVLVTVKMTLFARASRFPARAGLAPGAGRPRHASPAGSGQLPAAGEIVRCMPPAWPESRGGRLRAGSAACLDMAIAAPARGGLTACPGREADAA